MPPNSAARAIGVHKAKVKGETIYRLRVGGLTKADAAAMCARLKGEGGAVLHRQVSETPAVLSGQSRGAADAEGLHLRLRRPRARRRRNARSCAGSDPWGLILFKRNVETASSCGR